ncbi:MAG: hypothetical protein WC612_08375 [Bdellovibrionales bacterium]|jgi:hypothetical protein
MKKKTFFAVTVALSVGIMLPVLPAQAAVHTVKKARFSNVGQQAPQTRFAKAIEDLPLMEGLEVVEDKDVLFILGPERIAQTTAKGRVDIDKIYYFYQQSLPQMGWREVTASLYERAGERLHVEASCANSDGMTYVRFSVEPISKEE